MYKCLAFLERSTVCHLVAFDLEARYTALVGSILLATHTGNLQHTEQSTGGQNNEHEHVSVEINVTGTGTRTE